MRDDPLRHPTPDSAVLAAFLDAGRIDAAGPATEVLGRVATAFARLPYENLTKILKHADAGSPAEARRGPAEVVADHLRLGTGGTCFALTAALLHLVRALGWRAEPVLADRRYGPDTHCALLVWLDGRPHLLDPGYLLVRPVPLPRAGEVRLPTAFNEVVLTARDGGRRVDLHTRQQGGTTYRLTYRADPADAAAFLRAWDASFAWDMMRYPVLTRVAAGRQIYLQENRLQVRGNVADSRSESTTLRREVDPEDLVAIIAREFGIDPAVAARALAVLRRKGEGHGGAAIP
jgi:arylamine N-acetyltransferase